MRRSNDAMPSFFSSLGLLLFTVMLISRSSWLCCVVLSLTRVCTSLSPLLSFQPCIIIIIIISYFLFSFLSPSLSRFLSFYSRFVKLVAVRCAVPYTGLCLDCILLPFINQHLSLAYSFIVSFVGYAFYFATCLIHPSTVESVSHHLRESHRFRAEEACIVCAVGRHSSFLNHFSIFQVFLLTIM